MTNQQSSFRNIANLSQAIGLVLFLLHLYYYCYGMMHQWGLTFTYSDRVLSRIEDTGLFANPTRSKTFILLFMVFSLLSSRPRKEEYFRKGEALALVFFGLVIYFIYSPANNIGYMIVLTFGLLIIYTGAARLGRALYLPWLRSDPFGRRKAGFPQNERLQQTDFSLHLRARYTWQGKQRDSWINLINPRRGILILGSPGCGKSWFIIKPLLRQLMEKGFALFIYDFKYDTLTRQAYSLFLANQDKYPAGTKFYSINFTDLSRSHRCNLLDPATIEWMSDAIAASRTILLSMNKSWLHRQGDFFVESPINFVAALIWFLRKYKDGVYCTLPHVIELAQLPYDQLFPLLDTDPQIRILINPFLEAYDHKVMEMLEGQIASAKIPLGRLASPEVYYILTGNDVSLDINNPLAPKILCLGGDAARQESLGPVISLYIDRLNRIINRPEKYPCAVVCDEFATVRAYSMMDTIATGRSNNIIPILALQDLSQLRTQYSKDEADLILNVNGNILCGQASGDTARWVNEQFPRIQQERTTVSLNSSDTSISKSLQWEPTVTPATIANLSSGEFLGITADDPDQEMELKAFHARLSRHLDDSLRPVQLPVVRSVTAMEVLGNFYRVRQDIADMLLPASHSINCDKPASQNLDLDENS